MVFWGNSDCFSFVSDHKQLSKSQARKLAKLKSTLNLSILKDGASKLDGEPKLTSFKDIEHGPMSLSGM